MKIIQSLCYPSPHLTMKEAHQPLEYVPKSPVYPPPDDSSENTEFSSVPDLESPQGTDVTCPRQT